MQLPSQVTTEPTVPSQELPLYATMVSALADTAKVAATPREVRKAVKCIASLAEALRWFVCFWPPI
jgi:hypothetical protein